MQDDFLENFPNSMEGKEAIELWKTLGNETCPGLKDRFRRTFNIDKYLDGGMKRKM